MANLTSITGLSQTLSYENHNNLHDVSFSSYSKNGEKSFIHKLAESSRILNQISAQEKLYHAARKREDEEEIGVFSAEKYFNGVIDAESPRITNMAGNKCLHVNKDGQRNDHAVPATPKVDAGTPSVHSESSWNSQNALLQSIVRNSTGKKTNKVHAKSILTSLGCKCLCSDKDSIDVNEHVGEISFKKNPNAVAGVVEGKAVSKDNIKCNLESELIVRSGSWVRELEGDNCFNFPTLSSSAGNLPMKIQLQVEEELKPRKSIEVFGSPLHEKRNESSRIERRLKMFSWDVTQGMEENDSSAKSSGVYNDNGSDASSDLFEIESLTGRVNPFLARQESGTSGCVTPCYAPSEASIEWSVVTASAADFSLTSDYEELRPPTTIPSPIKMFPVTKPKKIGAAKEMPRHRPSISLGCTSHKAVRVVEDAYRTYDKVSFDPQMHGVLEPYMPVTRIQAEDKLTGFDSKHRQQALANPCSHTRSPHGSGLLFIQ